MRQRYFQLLIGLFLAACGGVQEDPPQAAPEPTSQPEPECTAQTLGDDLFADLEREEEAKQGGGDMGTLQAQMEHFGDALQEAADRITTPPRDLPDFPAIWIELVTHTSTRTAKMRDGNCVADLESEEHRHSGSYMCFPGWSCAAALFQMSFNELATDDLRDTTSTLTTKIHQRYFRNGLSSVSPMGEFVRDTTDERIADAFSNVFTDERQTKAFMEWVLKWVPKQLASHAALLERAIKELWEASSVAPGEEESPEVRYLNVRGQDLANVFRAMHRSGEDGSRSVIYLRYWLVQMAHALHMHEAFSWGGDVNAQLRNAGLAYEQMYRSALKEMIQ